MFSNFSVFSLFFSLYFFVEFYIAFFFLIPAFNEVESFVLILIWVFLIREDKGVLLKKP